MHRRARVVHLARRRIGPLILELKSTPTEKWPPHLGLARALLRGKPDLPNKTALNVIVGSVIEHHERQLAPPAK